MEFCWFLAFYSASPIYIVEYYTTKRHCNSSLFWIPDNEEISSKTFEIGISCGFTIAKHRYFLAINAKINQCEQQPINNANVIKLFVFFNRTFNSWLLQKALQLLLVLCFYLHIIQFKARNASELGFIYINVSFDKRGEHFVS